MKLVTEIVIVAVLSVVVGTGYHMTRDSKTKIPFVGNHKCNFDRKNAKSGGASTKQPTPTETASPTGTPTDGGSESPATPDANTSATNTPDVSTPENPVASEVPDTGASTIVADDEEELGEYEITVQSAFEDYFTDDLGIFIDARRGKHFEPGHISGARSLSPWEGDYEERLEAFMNAEAESGRPVVIYCTGGDCEDSHAVADRLRAAGFEEVVILRAGFPGWKKAGHPVETGPEKTDN